MPWFPEVVESEHDLQNPTSAEKLRLLGEQIGLGPDSTVLDIGSGRAGPAIVLADTFGCRITCVEQSEAFHAAAELRVHKAALENLIDLVKAEAENFPLETDAYDVTMCLGANFIWDGIVGTLRALVPATRSGGHVVVGDAYWRTWPPPPEADPELRDEFLALAPTVETFTDASLAPVTLIDSSVDDWDRYESLHWATGEAWLREHADDPGSIGIREELDSSRQQYLQWQRSSLGWAIIAGQKAPGPGTG